mgnify:CR=1 FL=1
MAFGESKASDDAWTAVVFGTDRVTIADIARPSEGKPKVQRQPV